MTKKHENSLTDRQKKALPFLVGSRTYEEGCKKAGISKHAFYTWLQNPSFKGELSQMQDEVVACAIESLKSNMTHATNALVSLLDRTDNPSLLRSVCNDVIGHVLKFKELQEIEKRIVALEDIQFKKEAHS